MEHSSALAFREEMKRCRLERGWNQENVETELGLSRGVVSRWERGEKPVSVRKISLLKDFLEMNEAIAADYFSYRAEVWPSPYTYGSLADLTRRGYDQEGILGGALEVYKQYPEPMLPDNVEGSNDYGTDEKWARMQQAFPESFFCVLSNQDNKVKAYFHILSLTDEAYEAGVRGENINKHLTRADCIGFLLPERHSLYIVDVFTDRAAKDPVINEIMLNMFTSFLVSLRNTGHKIIRMMTNTSEYEAINYCKSLNFNKACDHQYHKMHDPDAENEYPPTEIWELNIGRDTNSKLFEMRPALRKLLE